MKKIFRIPVLFVLVFFFIAETKARAPRQAYNSGNYYYFPEIDTWYDISNRRFIYYENARWIFSREISGKYRNYDVNNGYKVLVDETRPYVNANRYRDRYINYYTAYNNSLRNRDVPAEDQVYRNDRSTERRQPAYDANGRIEDGRIQDRQPSQTRKIPSQTRPGNDEPFENRPVPETKRVENMPPAENRNTENNKQPELTAPATGEKREEPVSIPERKPFEPGTIHPVEKTGSARVEPGTKDIRIKEESRARIEPIKKEPVKTDTVPVINRNRVPVAPGGSREAQYSEKYKKQTGG